MAESRYKQLAVNIVQEVGGKGNIANVAHCISRLRFNLKDQGLANIETLEKMNGIVGVKLQNGQVQVIIGQYVGEVYAVVCEEIGIKSDRQLQENLDTPKQKLTFGGVLNAIIDTVSGSISPIIPVLIGVGMLKVVVQLLGSAGLGLFSAESGTNMVLSFVGDAGFYFLPILVGATAAKKLNTNQGFGMLMGAILVSPTFVSLVSEGASLNIFGIPITAASYGSTVLPVIMVVWVMKYVYGFFTKISPNVLKSLLVPLCTLLVMIPVALCAVAPFGVIIGNYITAALVWLYDTAGALGVAVLAAVYPLLIMTGMHATLTPTLLMLFTTLGYEPFIIFANVCANMAIGASALAISIRSKEVDTKSGALATCVSAIIGGVTEPALFGFVLRLKRPLIGVMIGGFAGGLIGGIFKVHIYVMPGSGGIFSLPAFVGPESTNLIITIVSFVVAVIVSFIATYIIGIEGKGQKTSKTK